MDGVVPTEVFLTHPVFVSRPPDVSAGVQVAIGEPQAPSGNDVILTLCHPPADAPGRGGALRRCGGAPRRCGDAPARGGVPRGDVRRGGVRRGGVRRGGVPRGGVPRGGVPRGGVLRCGVPRGGGPPDDDDGIGRGAVAPDPDVCDFRNDGLAGGLYLFRGGWNFLRSACVSGHCLCPARGKGKRVD